LRDSEGQLNEHDFQLTVRKWLNDRYHPRGVWWPNTTGYGDSHHDPFGGVGAGDIIGCLCGRWVEIELKVKRGRVSERQAMRRVLVRKCGGVYEVVWLVDGWQELLADVLDRVEGDSHE